jgi:hypothetical protein
MPSWLSRKYFKIFAAESEDFGDDPEMAMLTITRSTNTIPPSAPYRSHFIESSITGPPPPNHRPQPSRPRLLASPARQPACKAGPCQAPAVPATGADNRPTAQVAYLQARNVRAERRRDAERRTTHRRAHTMREHRAEVAPIARSSGAHQRFRRERAYGSGSVGLSRPSEVIVGWVS